MAHELNKSRVRSIVAFVAGKETQFRREGARAVVFKTWTIAMRNILRSAKTTLKPPDSIINPK